MDTHICMAEFLCCSLETITALLISYCSSVVKSCQTLCDPMNCRTSGFPVLHYLPESLELAMPSNHVILCHPLLLLPSVFPTIRVFSNESAPRIRWPDDGPHHIRPVSEDGSMPRLSGSSWHGAALLHPSGPFWKTHLDLT